MARSIPADLRAYLPQWTARVAGDFGGRDPLGLSPVAHLFTDRLLGGIITTTNRARYYAIYCWILWHIGQTEPPTTESDFKEAFQRREAAFAIGTVLDPEAKLSPIGVDLVRRKLGACDDTVALDFAVLPSNPYGGFGANYSGCMYALGLWHRPTPLREEVTEGAATSLALAVEATLAKTAFASKCLWRGASADLDDMRSSASALSLAAITRPLGAAERVLVTNLLFGWEGTTPSHARAERRETLAWILWIVAEYERMGIACPSESRLEHHLLYAPLYSGVLASAEPDRSATCSPPPRLAAIASMWCHFAAHAYLTFALEEVLASMLKLLDGKDDGLERSNLVAALLADGFDARLQEATGRICQRPRDLLLAMDADPHDAKTDSRRVIEPRPVADQRAEPNLAAYAAERPGAQLANGLLLLAAVFRRWRSASDDPASQWLRISASSELWTGSVLPALDVWFDPELAWPDAVLALVDRFVINQHDLVMYGKGRLESCWLRVEGNRVHFDQELKPQFRASRLPQAVNMLLDLGLLCRADRVDEDKPDLLRITAEGRKVLARVMEVAS